MSALVICRHRRESNKSVQPTVYAVSVCVHVRKLTFSHTNRLRIHCDWPRRYKLRSCIKSSVGFGNHSIIVFSFSRHGLRFHHQSFFWVSGTNVPKLQLLTIRVPFGVKGSQWVYCFYSARFSAMATGNVGGRVKRALLSVTSKLVYFVRRVYFFSVGSGRLGSKHVGEYIGAQCYNNSLSETKSPYE